MGLVWALPTAQTIETVGSDQNFSFLVRNCETQRIMVSIFKVLELGLRCKSYEWSNRSFLFTLNDNVAYMPSK